MNRREGVVMRRGRGRRGREGTDFEGGMGGGDCGGEGWRERGRRVGGRDREWR